MYQALLYLKTNPPVCLFTHSKGIMIGPYCQEMSGVSKVTLAMNNPVEECFGYKGLVLSKKYVGVECVYLCFA